MKMIPNILQGDDDYDYDDEGGKVASEGQTNNRCCQKVAKIQLAESLLIFFHDDDA